MNWLTGAMIAIVLAAAGLPAGAAMPHNTMPQLNDEDDDAPAPRPAVKNRYLPPIDAEDDTPKPTISISTIEKPSVEGYGTLEQSNGGLPATIWKSSSRAQSEALLGQMHSGIVNDTLLNLYTRLLMTQAEPPPGSSASAQDWFGLRVQTLMNMGQDEKADQMIASLPRAMSTDSLRQTHSEILLLRGDVDGACKTVGANSAAASGATQHPVFWQKLTILCQARAGKQTEVMVGIDVLREENQLNDNFLAEAIHKLNDKNAVIKSTPKEWSVIDVALVRLTGDSLMLRDHLENVPPVALKYLAIDNSLDAKLREKATGRAQVLGIIPVRQENKTPEQPFEKKLASDVITLVTALGSGKPAGDGDNAIIARLPLGDDAGIQDNRRVQKLLTLMEPFSYKVPPNVWEKLYSRKIRYDGEVPPANYIGQLNEAAEAGRKAEVILLAGLIIDGTDTDKITDLALLPVIKALIKVGFDKEARQIAYSAVKGYR